MHILIHAFSLECTTEKKLLSYFSTKAYCVGIQKKCFYETVLLSLQTYTESYGQENIYNFLVSLNLLVVKVLIYAEPFTHFREVTK